jgi:hypothetical protein
VAGFLPQAGGNEMKSNSNRPAASKPGTKNKASSPKQNSSYDVDPFAQHDASTADCNPITPEPGFNASNKSIDTKQANGSKSSKVSVNSALIDAILELERQDEIQAALISNYIEHLKRLVAQLETVMQSERSTHAKILLYRHILPDTDWVDIITDQRIQAWQDEAAARKKLFEEL